MTTERAIQINTQMKAGIPVAAAIFAASECMFVVVEIKKTLIKSKVAFSSIWTVIKAIVKLTTVERAYFAIESKIPLITSPEKTVKKKPPIVTVLKR